ncbi:hypothetical protein FGF1_38780 [Flavobacteriaceae bacterium GF1]
MGEVFLTFIYNNFKIFIFMKPHENSIEEISRNDLKSIDGGHWAIAAAISVTSFFYQLGKDSYELHPESLI